MSFPRGHGSGHGDKCDHSHDDGRDANHGHGKRHVHSGHHGGHGHHGHNHSSISNIKLAFALNLVFSGIEFVGGFLIGSLAIMADAVHDLGDSMSLGLAWFFERYASRNRDKTFNFGYRRFSLLSALISGVIISTASIFIILEAIDRIDSQEPPLALPMIGLALLGLAVNGFAAWRLSHGQTQNEKILTWHLIEDVMGWAVILIGAIVIAITGIVWIDRVLAIGLAAFVIYNVLKHLKETAYLFLQGRPRNFSEEAFLREATEVPGVGHIDQLSVWSLDGESSILSARLHIHQIRDPMDVERVKEAVRLIASRHGAIQTTLETCLAEQAPHEPYD